MKANALIIALVAGLFSSMSQAASVLPEALNCKLTSVSPAGQGSTFRKQIQILKVDFDPSKSVRSQSDFILLPNELPLYIEAVGNNSVDLIGSYKNPLLRFSRENGTVKLVVHEFRGGGTGYGTDGFSVQSRYTCVE